MVVPNAVPPAAGCAASALSAALVVSNCSTVRAFGGTFGAVVGAGSAAGAASGAGVRPGESQSGPAAQPATSVAAVMRIRFFITPDYCAPPPRSIPIGPHRPPSTPPRQSPATCISPLAPSRADAYLLAMNIPLIDPFQRTIDYLRVSVTDRCDFRCVYCMSENMTFLPKKELLTLEELDRMCSTFVGMGVRKLRITGGEPLVRREIMTFFDSMSRHLDSGALSELTLTTNGSQLERFAAGLYAAGVRRVNVSLDTADEQKFADITRWGRLPQVLRGIDAAQNAGLRVKINAVALKGFNEDELFSLTEWCASRDMDLTWIEVMPMGDIGNEDRLSQYWPLKDLRARLSERYTVTDLPERVRAAPRAMSGWRRQGKRSALLLR